MAHCILREWDGDIDGLGRLLSPVDSNPMDYRLDRILLNALSPTFSSSVPNWSNLGMAGPDYPRSSVTSEVAGKLVDSRFPI